MTESPQQPLISVVIPTWNAADTLPQTLDTVFNQTWPSIQVVVVDDGSTDHTGEVLAGYGDRITPVNLGNSGGPSRPRNQGIEHSRGQFIAFFDSDDLMEPDKLAQAMAVFAQHPETDFVCSNFRSIDPAGTQIKADYLADYQQFRSDLQRAKVPGTGLMPGEKAFSHLLRANFVGTSSVVCRRKVFQEVGPFDETMKNADDIDMWLRIAHHGHGFAFINRVLHSYRITPGGVTARGAARIPAMVKGLENQLPHCRRQEDRLFIHAKVRALHLDRAWELRQAGDLTGALESYRAGLAMGWAVRPFVGLLKTRLQTLTQKD